MSRTYRKTQFYNGQRITYRKLWQSWDKRLLKKISSKLYRKRIKMLKYDLYLEFDPYKKQKIYWK